MQGHIRQFPSVRHGVGGFDIRRIAPDKMMILADVPAFFVDTRQQLHVGFPAAPHTHVEMVQSQIRILHYLLKSTVNGVLDELEIVDDDADG